MKKILGVLVATMLCVCMLVPVASAISDIQLDDIASFGEAEVSEMEAALDKYLAGGSSTDTTADTSTTAAAATSSIMSLLDFAWLSDIMPSDSSALTDMLSGFDASNLDSLLAVVSDAMSGAGIDLSTFDASTLGSFDITSVLSSTVALSDGETQDLAATVTNMTAGLADTLKSGLTALGLDTSTVESLLDNDIVNFFANMYIGFIGEVEEETTAEETTTEKKETTTKKPAVVTTKPPKTGDTSAVVVAVATLTMASGAAFVCLKKKED